MASQQEQKQKQTIKSLLLENFGIEVEFLQEGGTALVFTVSGENLLKLSKCCLSGISGISDSRSDGEKHVPVEIQLTPQQIRTKNFVVKIYKKTRAYQSFEKSFTETCDRLNTYREYISSIPSQEGRKSFLLPVSCGRIHITDKFSSYFEIQEYGGMELLEVFNKVIIKRIVLSKPKIKNALTSLVACLEGIVYIISTYKTMILDIKAENMVMNVEDGEVRMIDIDWVSIKDFKTSVKGRSFTATMKTMPGQMLARILHDLAEKDQRKYQKARTFVDNLYDRQLWNDYTLFNPQQINAERQKTKQVLSSIPSLLQHNDEMCVQLAYFHTGWSMLHIMLSVLKYVYVLQDERITSQFYDNIVIPFHQLRLENATKENMDRLVLNLKEFISRNFQNQPRTRDRGQDGQYHQRKRKKSSSVPQEPKKKQQQQQRKQKPTICSIM